MKRYGWRAPLEFKVGARVKYRPPADHPEYDISNGNLGTIQGPDRYGRSNTIWHIRWDEHQSYGWEWSLDESVLELVG